MQCLTDSVFWMKMEILLMTSLSLSRQASRAAVMASI